MLILAGGIGNIFIVLAVPAVKTAGVDGWMSVLIGYGLAALVGICSVKLGSLFPNKTFVEYLPLVYGKFLGKTIGLFYILSFWVMTPLILRETIELMRFFLPLTPKLLISCLIS